MTLKNSESTAFKLNRSDFGEDFLWGVSTSALQIEGGHDQDGKGPSIWDEFAAKKNKIANNDSPNTAADFYTHYKEDIALMKRMGVPNFRFSIAWSRILPEGTGRINQAGLDFYHKVLDECRVQGIEPFVTLYHWDLPLALDQQGGWTNRQIIEWFKEYVTVCVNAFKDKVKYWMVLNEPSVFTGGGYFLGLHAPGKKGLGNFLPAMHHALLCQSVGFTAIKEVDPSAQVGTTFSCTYVTPKAYTDKDIKATERVDCLLNRAFIEPSLGMGYPSATLPFLRHMSKYMMKGDEELLKVPFDFIGIQCYTREVVAHNSYVPYINAKIVPANKRNVAHTAMNWEVYPKSIYYMILKYSAYEDVKSIVITESGAAFKDEHKGGKVNDKERLHYLQSYLEQVHQAKEKGGKVDGYFVWSFMDNFEWAEGYHKRFGLVHVNFETQERTVKSTGLWYREFLDKKE